jgi:hypothetical protein
VATTGQLRLGNYRSLPLDRFAYDISITRAASDFLVAVRETLRREVTMTGDQSRQLNVGDRVCWNADSKDHGTIIETNWAA